MQAIAKIEKVSYEQFEKDWEKNMGGSKKKSRQSMIPSSFRIVLQSSQQDMIFMHL